MASVLRNGLSNLNSSGLFLLGLCKTASKRRGSPITLQIARISGRELRRDNPPKPPPYDWRNKGLPFWTLYTDPMMERMDENSKVVVVEGMPAVGKDKFARKLAEELEMHYIPPPNFDEFWVNPYGFDMRSLNDKLPIDAQAYDLTTFLKDPKHRNVASMQTGMLILRCSQYVDALAHLLSTGDGVVLQRTPWTDAAFMRAMAAVGYVSKLALDYHRCASEATLLEFLKPHLVIHLDAPIDVIKKNIEKRNIPYEVKSPALTDEYLNELNSAYKDYLKEIAKDAHLLIYDWSTEGDIGIVVEDIERLDFDLGDDLPPGVRKTVTKFQDWKFKDDRNIQERRWDYCIDKFRLMSTLLVQRYDVPEVLCSGQDHEIRRTLLSEVKSEEFAPGYVPACGDNVWFKTKTLHEDWVPRSKVPKAQ